MQFLRAVPFTFLVFGLLLISGSLSSEVRPVLAAPEDDIAALFDNLVTVVNDGDTAAMAALFTDDGLAAQFGTDREGAEEALQATLDEAGMIIASSITEVTVDETGQAATAVVEIEFDSGFALKEIWHFELVNDAWLIGENELISQPIPEGVTAVSLELDEYSFNFDKSAVASGNVAFEVTNVGEEEHEVVVVALHNNDPVADVAERILASDILESEDPSSLPDDIEFLGFGGFWGPGQQANFVPDGPFEDGRYAFICFFPSPDGTPHLALGMISDFTVGSVAPPSTGDAGLLDKSEDELGWTFLALGGIGVAIFLAATLKRTSAANS